jgi:hypothetical protein
MEHQHGFYSASPRQSQTKEVRLFIIPFSANQAAISRALHSVQSTGLTIKYSFQEKKLKKKTGSSSYLEPREILFWIANRASQEKSLHSATSK